MLQLKLSKEDATMGPENSLLVLLLYYAIHLINSQNKKLLSQFPPQVKQYIRAHPLSFMLGWVGTCIQAKLSFAFFLRKKCIFYPGSAL